MIHNLTNNNRRISQCLA